MMPSAASRPFPHEVDWTAVVVAAAEVGVPAVG